MKKTSGKWIIYAATVFLILWAAVFIGGLGWQNFGIILFGLVLIVLVFFIVARQFIRRVANRINTGGMMTADMVQRLGNGTPIQLSEMAPAMTMLLNPDILPSLQPNPSRHGHWRQWSYYWTDMIPSALATDKSVLMVAIVARMPGQLPGTIYWTRDPVIGGDWFRPNALESVEFNKEFSVMASNKQLAFAALSPDFMAWLLEHDMPAMIYLVDGQCVLWFTPNLGTPETILKTCQTIFEFIEESGALEPIAKKA